MLQRAENGSVEQFVRPHVETAEPDAHDQAEPRPERFYIAYLVKAAADIRGAPGILILAQFVIRPPASHRFARLLSGQHPRQNRVMGALDAGEIHESRRTANESPSGKDQFWRRLPTAGRNRACAAAYAFGPREGLAHHRMGLETLKLIEWRKRGVFIIEMHHKSHRHQPVAIMIEK